VKVNSEPLDAKTRVFHLHGPLFFGSALNYKMEVNPVHIEESEVILDFRDSTVLDISGTNAIAETRQNLMGAGKKVIIRGLPKELANELPTDAIVEPVPSSNKSK